MQCLHLEFLAFYFILFRECMDAVTFFKKEKEKENWSRTCPLSILLLIYYCRHPSVHNMNCDTKRITGILPRGLSLDPLPPRFCLSTFRRFLVNVYLPHYNLEEVSGGCQNKHNGMLLSYWYDDPILETFLSWSELGELWRIKILCLAVHFKAPAEYIMWW